MSKKENLERKERSIAIYNNLTELAATELGKELDPDILLDNVISGAILVVVGTSDEPLSPQEIEDLVVEPLTEEMLSDVFPTLNLEENPLSRRVSRELTRLLEEGEINHTGKRELVRAPNKRPLSPCRKEIREAQDFDELFSEVSKFLERAKENSPEGRIGYVAGILTSDGPENYERNKWILEQKTQEVRERVEYPVFCANDIFSEELVDRLGYESSGYISFWRRVLSSGLVTHVHMTPRWDESEGATDEHDQAKNLGLEVIYED